MSDIHKNKFAKDKSAKPHLELIDKTKKPTKKQFKQFYERQGKLTTLFKKYNISTSDTRAWAKLAIYLAEEYVPGFNPRAKRIFWNPTLKSKLLYSFRQCKREFPAKTDLEICEHLILHSPWKERNITARTLQNEFCKIKRSRGKRTT